jgi:hypothetical protein
MCAAVFVQVGVKVFCFIDLVFLGGGRRHHWFSRGWSVLAAVGVVIGWSWCLEVLRCFRRWLLSW